MSEYVGNVKDRIQLRVVLKGNYTYSKTFGYSTQYFTIYTMEDESGNVFVWKTSSSMMIESVDENGYCVYDPVRKGDSATIKATITGHSEYKGVKQTVLSRCKVLEISHIKTKQEIEAEKKEAQLLSLGEGDFIWSGMLYSQYKKHYSDCETVCGSFVESNSSQRGRATIDVIIRAGRLVPSGSRGKHYSGFEFTSKDGKRTCYRAISEENAAKQLARDFDNSEEWECTKIYRY